MLPIDIESWLRTNTSAGSAAHARTARSERRALLSALGITEDSQLGYFYLMYSPDSVRGWYELARLEEVSACTEYAHEELEVPDRFLALSSREGDGIVLYDTASGAVFDVEIGQFEALESGDLPPKGATFVDFLRWCKENDEAESQGPSA